MQGFNNQMDINVNLKEAETIICSQCSGRLFEQQFILKLIPKIMLGAPTDIPVPIPIWRCTDCGTIAADIVPPGVGTIEDLFSDPEPKSGIII